VKGLKIYKFDWLVLFFSADHKINKNKCYYAFLDSIYLFLFVFICFYLFLFVFICFYLFLFVFYLFLFVFY